VPTRAGGAEEALWANRTNECSIIATRDGPMVTRVSSREFNQDTSGAKRAAERGPVFITDRGRPSHVLLTFEAYEKLLGVHLVDRLGEPAGVEDVELTIRPSDEPPQPAAFD
jgi:hypothetical protein